MGCTQSREVVPPKNIYDTKEAREFRASKYSTTEGYVNTFQSKMSERSERSEQPQDTKQTKPARRISHNLHDTLGNSSVEDVPNRRKAKQGKRNIFVPQISVGTISDFRPPKFEKSEEECTFLRDGLMAHFLFQHLSNKELDNVISAFDKASFSPGETIIKQGDSGDFFFVVYSGTCLFDVDGTDVGHCGVGDTFGELSLLYSSPRAATVTATTAVQCFRVDQRSFRFVLQLQNQRADTEKLKVLQSIFFLKGLETFQLQKLSTAMTLNAFRKGDYICRKGEIGNVFYIIHEGEVNVTDIEVGDTKYEDFTMGPGEYFGERAIVKHEPRAANVIANTDSIIFSIDRNVFEKVLGDVANLILRAQDKSILAGIKCIKNTHFDSATLDLIAGLIKDETYRAGEAILKEGEILDPAFYIIRSGKCKVTSMDGTYKDETIIDGGLFGEQNLTMDVDRARVPVSDNLMLSELQNRDSSSHFAFENVFASYSVEAIEETLCGVLYLKDCRSVIDTTTIGQGPRQFRRSKLETMVLLNDLKRHVILGQGTFGQVWLVSAPDRTDTEIPFALKIQAKYELVKNGQANGAVREMETMTQLHHPFLLRLVKTFQDREFIYMLLRFVQGGELYNRVHTDKFDGIPEFEARFYAAGIVEALSYMHRRQIVYRDLKPENVLIDKHGYPVIVDFGFAKHVPEKTYSLCGSPFYMAPEVILNRGHSVGADHWSLGCIIYEMITGVTPFEENVTEIALYMAILKGNYPIPSLIKQKQDALNLVQRLLTVEPSERLGVLADGQLEIFKHQWFYEIDFDILRNRAIPPPWVPSVKDPLDTSKFENKSDLIDRTSEHYPEISQKDQDIFVLFGQC